MAPGAARVSAKKIEKDSALCCASHMNALGPSIVLINCSCVMAEANKRQSSKVVRSQHNKGRLNMKTLIIAALVAGIATPVFAQSFDPENGTGNVLWRHAPIAQDAGKAPGGLNGENAYASAPGMRFEGKGPVTPNDVARTGGGSIGYNEKLLHD
jgi:hypothetical protein